MKLRDLLILEARLKEEKENLERLKGTKEELKRMLEKIDERQAKRYCFSLKK
ncbi:hypothetical protein [Moorella sp. Hama-1]|uniref:hypothetical protein n=1 Tax=Moorella sp. Hama-1 TaxID=2138101 RepID=UPI00137A6415|nr:hypothetical protein [Moorella sp. Hama-1]BCV22981.1 hypothetical protein hamaS1_30500 [Moorella sp. Hama-1]